MVISLVLTPEQQAWLDAHVANGDFTSVEAAARQLIAERIQERVAEEADDLTWAGPYIAEALEEAVRGDVLTLEEHRARNAARLTALKG